MKIESLRRVMFTAFQEAFALRVAARDDHDFIIHDDFSLLKYRITLVARGETYDHPAIKKKLRYFTMSNLHDDVAYTVDHLRRRAEEAMRQFEEAVNVAIAMSGDAQNLREITDCRKNLERVLVSYVILAFLHAYAHETEKIYISLDERRKISASPLTLLYLFAFKYWEEADPDLDQRMIPRYFEAVFPSLVDRMAPLGDLEAELIHHAKQSDALLQDFDAMKDSGLFFPLVISRKYIILMRDLEGREVIKDTPFIHFKNKSYSLKGECLDSKMPLAPRGQANWACLVFVSDGLDVASEDFIGRELVQGKL